MIPSKIPQVSYSFTQFLLAKRDFLDPSPALNEGMYETIYGTVYLITDLRNGRVYVGQTMDFNRRLAEYVRYSRLDRPTVPIYTSIREGGIEHFRMKRLWECQDKQELVEMEQKYILEFDSSDPAHGYNMHDRKDWQHNISDESRKKMSEVHIGKNMGSECKRKHGRPCVAIHPEEKTVHFAPTMRLLGDAIFQCDRSMIAHAANYLHKLHGYYIFYRDAIMGDRMLERLEDMYERNRGKRSGCTVGRVEELQRFYGIVRNETYDDLVQEGYELHELDFTDDGLSHEKRKVENVM